MPASDLRNLITSYTSGVEKITEHQPDDSAFADPTPAQETRRHTVAHTATAQLGYEYAPWLELADDLDDLLDGQPLTDEDTQTLLDITADHLAKAQARINNHATACDMSDPIAVANLARILHQRAADLRFIQALTAAGVVPAHAGR